MQLVAYGAQDIYLTGNPQITFFKVVYRRHTNFSMETIEQTINGTSTLSDTGGTGTVTISRNGDLVNKVYVTVSDGNVTDGTKIVSEVELEIGGQKIDKHYEEWNNIWNELTTSEAKCLGLKSMQGAILHDGVELVQVPLNFWFCRNPGLALPLIALQYHEVKLKFNWGTDHGSTGTVKVYCDYIYLDTDERRRFAQVSHEYLIEQIQKQSANATTNIKLNFNHPVKELIWTSPEDNTYLNAKLVLNGHDRFSTQEEEYFQLRQPFDYHTAIPHQNLPNGAQAIRSYSTELTTDTHETDTQIGAGALGFTAAQLADGTAVGVGAGRMLLLETATDAETSDTVTGLTDYQAITAGAGTEAATKALYLLRCQEKRAAHIFTSAEAIQFNSAIGKFVLMTGTGLGPEGDKTSMVVKVHNVGSIGNSAAHELHGTDRAVFFGSPILKITGSSLTLASYPPQAGDGGFTIDTVSVIEPGSSHEARTSHMIEKINVYSFGLKPEEHQPSGTCNFSRIDNATLKLGNQLTVDNNIYAVNYNVLRIMSGMGGLAYSN